MTRIKWKTDNDHGALSDMTMEVAAWVKEKGWDDDRTFGDSMALLHSEVSEALEAFREHGLVPLEVQHINGPDDGSLPKPEGVASEFADVLIRLLDDCDRYGVDLFAEFRKKMDYNWTRTFRHGGKAL